MNYWDQLRNYLQQKVSLQEYENWLSGTSFLELHDRTLSVSVPDPQTRTWLEGEYAQRIQSGIQRVDAPVSSVAYQVELAPRPPESGQRHAR